MVEQWAALLGGKKVEWTVSKMAAHLAGQWVWTRVVQLVA